MGNWAEERSRQSNRVAGQAVRQGSGGKRTAGVEEVYGERRGEGRGAPGREIKGELMRTKRALKTKI